jgi:prefoldin alpha subunit
VKEIGTEDREKLQQLLAELSEYQATVDVLRQQISALATSLTELSITMGAIKVVKDLKQDTEILVPIGCDSFIAAKLSKVDRIITGLGANIAAEKSAEEATKLLEARAAEIEKALGRAREDLKKLEELIETRRPEAERIIQKSREASEK